MVSEYSTKRFCCEPVENIENYEAAMADKTQTWDCHHKLEIQGQFTNSVKLLKKCKMYFHRPANELIFLTHSEHLQRHRLACNPFTERKAEVQMTRLSDGSIKVFSSMGEAERWLKSNGFPKAARTNIWLCCSKHKKRQIAYGATWKFAESAK